MSILCLLFAEGLNHCCKDSSQEGFSMHQISRSHRRSVRRFRNTWLLSAQLCWLFLTDIPAQVFDSSMLLCQLCGALTHLFWMLFWFSTGEITIYIVQSTYLWDPGVEGIFLVFAMNNVTSISLHYLLLSAGTLLPIVMVVCILGFSISSNEEVCMREIKYPKFIPIQGLFESIFDWPDVPAVHHCHLWRHGHHLLAPTWLRDAAVEHSDRPHSPLKPHRAHRCSSYGLSICYIQVTPCFFGFGNISPVWMTSFLKEHSHACEGNRGSKELCDPILHPWTWILGLFPTILSFDHITACK